MYNAYVGIMAPPHAVLYQRSMAFRAPALPLNLYGIISYLNSLEVFITTFYSVEVAAMHSTININNYI